MGKEAATATENDNRIKYLEIQSKFTTTDTQKYDSKKTLYIPTDANGAVDGSETPTAAERSSVCGWVNNVLFVWFDRFVQWGNDSLNIRYNNNQGWELDDEFR